ncbi:type VI secretion system baseplate subunit TssG [Mucilaginibacter sp. RCC_168]|uniref:type VI secretion system baseplate subunit TssG n=1 Tax=Mucilaginibacter sp. RCC_168 TaxID=3239221 RepID=UPI003523B4BF
MKIKNPNLIDTDFKATVIAAEIVENELVGADDIVILPIGPQRRAFTKEIAGVIVSQTDITNKRMLQVQVNRDGLYDMLPEGLFHKPPASSLMITEEEMIKDIVDRRDEEKQTRRFFTPFEAEVNHLKMILELYENRLDKKNEYDDLINIFLKEWKEFGCFTNKQMLILIHVLPVIHEQRNNLVFIGKILTMLFKTPMSLSYKFSTNREGKDPANMQTSLGKAALGIDFIAGQLIEPEEELHVTVGPLSASKMIDFLPGERSAICVDVLLSYFIPMQTGVKINLLAAPASKKIIIGVDQDNARLGYTTYLGN